MSSPPVREAVCRASPSLALIKYWGKRSRGVNIPATPSLAVTLGDLVTTTLVRAVEGGGGPTTDSVSVNGAPQPEERFQEFFEYLRRRMAMRLRFEASSTNSFPSSAGLASSSSGFAALAVACAALAGRAASAGVLSEIARHGSASAARAVFGGFVLLPAGARSAVEVHPADHWPALRIVAAVVSREAKPASSRSAMEQTRLTSPYYPAWVSSSARLLPDALSALARRDLEKLGEVMRISYSRMHASLLAAAPPLLYWLPASVAVINECARMRAEGIGCWETMDAGPQVKILCLEPDLQKVLPRLRSMGPALELLVSQPGGPPVCQVSGERKP